MKRLFVAAALLMWPIEAGAAPAAVQQCASSTSSCAFTATVASGDAVVAGVWVSGSASPTITMTDDKSNVYTQVGLIGGSSNAAASFYALNLTNGPKTITVSTSAGTVGVVHLEEVSGVASSGALDGHGEAFFNSHAIGVAATTNW